MRVTGSFVPVIENPLPVRLAESTVTEAVPDAVNVRVWVEVVFKSTLPNARELALIDS